MSPAKSFIDTLETRMLMSVSPLNATVQMDHLQIRIDLLNFRSDLLATRSSLLSDIKAIKADAKPADADTITPLVVKFHSDMSAMRTALLEDRLTEAGNVLADESTIVTELKQMLKDKGNPTALAADKTQMKTDRIKLQNDMVAGLTARLTTRLNAYALISTDCQAIVTAVQSDTGASAKLVADVTKFASDRTSTLTILSGDLQKLLGDRQQLVTDLTVSIG